MSVRVSTRRQPLGVVMSADLARKYCGTFRHCGHDDNRGAWLLLHAHALFPLTIMPICVSKYSPALSFLQCFRYGFGNLAGEVRQRVVVDHRGIHRRVPAVLLDLAWILDPVEAGGDR